MIFNPADSAVDFAFSSVENWGESVLDKAVTELYPLKKADTAYTVTIPPGVLRILVKEQTLYAEKAWKNLPLTLSWQLKKAKKLRMAAEKPTVFQSVALPADFLSAGMHKQADFSGILTVTTTIKMAAAAEGYLVFDQICHAGKLSVNGKDCGTQIAEPWAFPVTLQQGENHLTLEIYSTAGNEWRRCVNEELEPRQWVNCYLPKLRKYTIDDAESGVLATATLWLPNKE